MGCVDRPRVRMQHPMLSFKASGTFRQSLPSTVGSPGDRLLPSGVPASTNVLEPLGGDRELRGIRPQLTALRLDRISTDTSLAATRQVIRSKPAKPFPALPAISARVRYSKSAGSFPRLATIASLDVEISPYQDVEVQLTDVNMQLSDGSVDNLCASHAIKLPRSCQPRDNLVFLFRLSPGNGEGHSSNPRSLSKLLEIWIHAQVLSSNICRPNVRMRWRTTIDFSTALNPNYGGPSQNMQRSNKPSSLPLASDDAQGRNASRNLDVATDDHRDSHQRATAIPGFGVTLTLTAPRDVYVGQPFTWDVFVVNRSDKAQKLAIVVIPKRKADDHQRHMAKPSVSSKVASQRDGMDHADAVMDENQLYAMQKMNIQEAAPIVCLSTDVRIGYVQSHGRWRTGRLMSKRNLNPGFCHNSELKFLPLCKGILNIEAVRVIDVLSNESIDIRDLPEIVAEERGSDDKET